MIFRFFALGLLLLSEPVLSEPLTDEKSQAVAAVMAAEYALQNNDTKTAAIEYIKAGTLRALAVTTAKRSEALPEIPTVDEFVPGYETSQWYGVGVPNNTPTEIVDKLNKEVNAALADPKMRARLADLGGTPLPGSSADFGKLIADETEKWGKVIKSAGIKPQ